MLTRTVRLQLIAFLVISVVSVVYALIRFTNVEALVGEKGYTVKLEMTDSGGIFSNAEVTYRGVQIGRVGELRLTHDGLEVDLNINADAPDVPADLDAVVANRSAVGEQFVDLRPRTAGGATLAQRPVITADRAKVPISTDTVVAGLDSLASSVPTDSLRTVVNELDDGFSGTGPSLQVLLDNASSLTKTAAEHLPQVVQLIDSGGTVLATVNRQSGNITSFSHDLRLLAAQLKTSDPDLRALIEGTPGAADQIDGLVRESGPGLGVVAANLLTVSNLALPRQDGLEQVLVTYPVLAVGSKTVLPGDGTVHLGLVANLFDPPPCTSGYKSTTMRRGDDTSPAAPNNKAYCAEPTGSPIDVRGSENAPYGGKPVSSPSQGSSGSGGGGGAQTGQQQSIPMITTFGQLLGLPG